MTAAKMTPARTIMMVLGCAMLALPSVVQAEQLKGSNFINVMEANTLSGVNREGARFHVYFLPGGTVTYQDVDGKNDHGTWMLDKDGDVCVTWSSLLAGKQNCYEVSVDKENVTWGNKDGTLHGGLLGGVEPLAVEKKQ